MMKKIIDIFRLSAVVLAATLFLPTTEVHAFPATQCAADRYGSNLGCTANDVSITGMSIIGDTTSCVGGTNVTLDLQMTVNFAVPDRWDIGIFISNDGKDPQIRAVNGGAASCSVSVLPNSSPFLNLDGGATGDTCGDGNGTIGGGTGSGIHFMPNTTVPCQSTPGASGNLYIPFVVSWDNQKTSPGAVCTSNADPVPNTTSKCNAPTVVQGSVAVVVLPSITKTDNKTTLFSGDSTSYLVNITNTTGASLSNAVFKDSAVSGIAVSSLSCAAAGGAACPGSSTVAAMQGAGITIPAMPVGGSVTFTVGATLTGTPGDTRTNTATVTVGSQTNTASDTNTIVDTIAILPTSQSKIGDTGATVTYTYTLYNFDTIADTITLAAVSSQGWTVGVSPTPVTVAAGSSAMVTVTVTIPGGASIGDVDSTVITATSGNNPGKTATATAVTTVTTALTLTPSNTGSGGAGSSVYYTHRVQNNASSSKTVSLTPSFTSGTCTGWTSALFESNKTTSLSSPVTLAASGGFKDFVLKITIPTGAAAASTCTATLTAAYTAGAPNAVSVTDVTTVKNLVLYEDPGYTTENYVYPAGNNVYAKGYGLTSSTNYEYRWYNSSGTEVCTPRATSTTGTIFPDTCLIPAAGPLGTWTVQIWNTTANPDTLFVQGNFYVGPDHLKASYSGANPPINTNTVIDLALHDKVNHVVPFDPSGNLVKGSPTDPEGPLMITVTVSGSATIVSTTLANAVITGQSVTGKLDSTTGTATLTISDALEETVTITPVSYKGVLYGSPARDEPAMVTFAGGGLHHVRLNHTGSAVTCVGELVTVYACNDADVAGACTANTSGLSGNVIAKSGGGATLATVPFSIAAGSSSTTVTVPVATAQTVALETSGLSVAPTASPDWTCWNGSAASCSNIYSDAGFIISGSAGGVEATIPTQVAGTTSSTYYLRAVKTSTTTKACEAALAGANTVNFAYECNNPTTCYTANLMSVNGGAATIIARNNNGSVSSYTSVNMTFDANGNAPFTFNYSDVGLVKLWVNKAAGGSLLTALAGSSNGFVVKPFGFVLSNIRQTAVPNLVNPAAANAAGAKFVKAGEDFSVTVTAVTATSTAAPNYGKETVPEGVTLTNALVAPAAGNNPALGNPAVFGPFSDGVATGTTFNWGEVGIITLTPSVADADYLGAGDITGTASANIGRFYPDHLDTAVLATATTPMLCPVGLTCPALYYGFVYSGQAFSVQVFARNLAGGTTTNYDDPLGFSKAVTLTAWDALGSTVTQNPPGTSVLANGSVAATAFGAGVATTAIPTYTFATSPTSPTDIYVRAEDTTDSVTSLRGVSSVEGGVKVVSGRIKIGNAHGSELLSLPMTAKVEYYNGSYWVTSATDNATSLIASDFALDFPVATANKLSACETAISVTGASPTFTLSLSAPGNDDNGWTNLTLNLGAVAAGNQCTAVGGAGAAATTANRPWLQFPVGSNPTARATFGVYKGANEFIYLRENY